MNVLIIDDHPLVREGIALMVREVRTDANVWEASSCTAGLEIASREPIDFAFLDLHLPDESGYTMLARLKQQTEAARVVVVSAMEDRESVMKAIDMGAIAYVAKSANTQHMRAVVKDLFEGRVCLPDSILGLPREYDAPDEWHLTDRQREVLALMVVGLPNKLIARRLNIVESTVKIHVSAILRELKVASRTQALLAVARSGTKLPLH